MYRLRTITFLFVSAFLPKAASSQSLAGSRLGITPSPHEYRMGRTASFPPIPREVRDYRVAGAVFFGVLATGFVIAGRQNQESTPEGNLTTDIFTVAAFTGIGALLGSLIKKDP